MKVEIVSGFLGAGKTTFINRYLSLVDDKTALIENEFGDTSIDTALIEKDLPIKEIFAGCVCCSLRGDLTQGIKELREKYNPDRLIIEPSGIGRLSDIVSAVMQSGEDITLERRVVLVDTEAFMDFIEDFGPFYKDQIEHADIIFMTFLDEGGDIEEIVRKIRELNTHAQIITADYRELEDKDLKKIIESAKVDLTDNHHDHHHHHDGGEVFSSMEIESEGLNEAGFMCAMEELNAKKAGILRAKGFLRDNGKLLLVNCVSHLLEVEEYERTPEKEVIVIIGHGLDEDMIRNTFDEYREEN